MDTPHEQSARILLLEPFYGGSHKQLIDLLDQELPECLKITLPAKKWHWRARTSALFFTQNIPKSDSFKTLFCSSVLNLCELIALRPDLANLHKILYFHENQLQYPVRKQQDRDFQYGYNQILSSMVADVVVFNSTFNMESFLTSIQSFLKLIPDHRPKNLEQEIRPKSVVIHFPIMFPPRELKDGEDTSAKDTIQQNHPDLCEGKSKKAEELQQMDASCVEATSDEYDDTTHEDKKTKLDENDSQDSKVSPVHIVWPHRWEHDKAPEVFFHALYKLQDQNLPFHVSVLGETYTDVPEIFSEAKEKLGSHVKNWGFQSSKEEYYNILRQADIVVSTANHEFFGVAMLEAVHLGCYPMCPNRLVYPEIFPKENLYNTDNQLVKKLRQFCERPDVVRRKKVDIDTEKYSWSSLAPMFKNVISPDFVTIH